MDTILHTFLGLLPNVTVQGTRHFVEGTLEPIVRFIFILYRCDGFGLFAKGSREICLTVRTNVDNLGEGRPLRLSVIEFHQWFACVSATWVCAVHR